METVMTKSLSGPQPEPV